MKIILVCLVIGAIYFFLLKPKKKKGFEFDFTPELKKFLESNVEFYRELDISDRKKFEKRLQHFLATTQVIGIKTVVEIKDRLLVASSAIIPVFAFDKWEYLNLNEVLLYPSAFDDAFETEGSGKNILGMVGSGSMEGKMILSKPALHAGFSNDKDKKNVGIHEFIHLIDKSDGVVDGVPSLLLDKQFTIPWLSHIRNEIDAIHALKSDINPYGGVSKEEFFPVISEYFFERPKLLKIKHPELYDLMNEIFTVDLSKRYKGKSSRKDIGRNDNCPCGSGKKFKRCCLLN